MTTINPLIVVGAGLSGLACAHAWVRAGRECLVLEAEAHAGGVVGSVEKDGFRWERGPHTVQARSAEFRRLCGELGIASRLIASNAEVRERYLYLDGRLQRVPMSPPALLKSSVLSWRSKARIATEFFRRWQAPNAVMEHDMQAVLEERLGLEATRKLGAAFVRGIYAADLPELGLRSAFPRLDAALREHGGIVRALLHSKDSAAQLPGPKVAAMELLSFPKGLQELVDALHSSMGARLRCSCAVLGLERHPLGWSVRTAADHYLAERVVLALPAKATARLLDSILDKPSGLDQIRHGNISLVHLGFERGAWNPAPRGFGFLVPPGEPAPQPKALGVIFSSNLFPDRAPQGQFSSASFYRSEDLAELDEAAIIAQACADLALGLSLKAAPRPQTTMIQRWKEVIPRYSVGHRQRIADLTLQLSNAAHGVHLAGPWVDGVSVEQVIARGRYVADCMLNDRSSEVSP